MPENINEIPNPNENNDNLLESLLENQDAKATETNQTLEQILENQDEKGTETNQLLENQLEMQDKIHDTIKELKPAMNAAGFIQNFMEAIKGDKGDKGDTPEKGKDYYTPEEIAEVVKQITDDIRIPEDGKTPEKGTDYFTEEEIKAVVNDVLSQIPVPSDGIDGKNGKDGLDGDDAVVDYEMVVAQVLAKLPKPKSVKEVTAEEILKKIKGSISYKDLKDLPNVFRGRGGANFFLELSDVELTNLANDETIKWDAVKQKWVNGSILLTNISGKVDKVAGSRLITTAEGTILGNTSNTNSGDNATNSQYSGLAASKQDVSKLPYLFVAASTASASQKAIADYICDGTADDVQINAALTALPAGGGVVELSAGTFNTTATIAWDKAHVTLRGQGMGITTIQTASANYHGIHQGTRQAGGALNSYQQMSDFTVTTTQGNYNYSAIWIDGAGQMSTYKNLETNGGKYGIIFEDLDRVYVENIQANNGYLGSVVCRIGLENTFGTCTFINVSAVLAYNNSTAWIWDVDANQANANPYDRITVLSSLFFKTEGLTGCTGMEISGGARSFKIQGSLFESPNYHIKLSSECHIEIENTSFIFNNGNATDIIQFSNSSSKVTLFNNKFQSSTNGFNSVGAIWPTLVFLGTNKNDGNITNMFVGSWTAKFGNDVQFAGDNVIQQGFSDFRYSEINVNSLVANTVKLITGAGAGKILTSDADGDASWTSPSIATTIIVCPTGTVTATTYDDDGYGRFVIDKSLFANIKAIYYRATLANTAAGTFAVYAELVDDGGTAVTGGELTASIGQWGQSIQMSGDIQAAIAATATVYRFKYKVASGGNGGSYTNEIIIQYYV